MAYPRLKARGLAAVGALALLAACGGDESGAPPNLPPSFGSATLNVSFPENSTDPVATLTVNDEATASVTLSLSGPDAALFTIRNGNQLSFVTPPDFEAPQDQGTDNVYNVTARATDALGSSSTIDIIVTVTDIATAQRFIDPVFASSIGLGTISAVTPSGAAGVSFFGPRGDTMASRPLVIIGNGASAASQSLAEGLALRGYLVGLTEAQAPADLFAVASTFAAGEFASLGYDREMIGIAASGDAAFAAQLDAAFAESPFTVHAFAAGGEDPRTAAGQFYAGMFGDRGL